MLRFPRRIGTAFVCAGLLSGPSTATADGTIRGQVRFEKLKGRPELGHALLYEGNLFLSPGDSSLIGPSRRLGAPPGQGPRHDGFYEVAIPAGTYSILVSQPLFFVRLRVVPEVRIEDGKTANLDIDLCIDYSTYFTETWALPFGSTWYQTFLATGRSIVGVSWKLAGTHSTTIRAGVHEDDGSPNPASWPRVSPSSTRADKVDVGADNWVRWRSGEVPTVPGRRYAVRLEGVEGGDLAFSPFNRAKDAKSYAGGQAYDSAGSPRDYDLNITVFSDNDGTEILYSKTTRGLGDLRDGYYDRRWGQTFRAKGSSLAAVDAWAAGANRAWDLDFTWTVREEGPAGRRVGPTKITRAAYQAHGAGLHGVSYCPGEVPLEEGRTYYVEFTHPVGFNPYVLDSPQDAYSEGAAYQDGVLKGEGDVDLSLSIVVYARREGTAGGSSTAPFVTPPQPSPK